MDYLATGVLRGPHGIQGFLKLHTFSREYDHLLTVEVVSLRNKEQSREMRIESFKQAGEEYLIKFAGVDTPEEARGYTGWEIWIPRDTATALEADEYYVADLTACSLLVANAVVGKVVAIMEGPQALLLEVEVVETKKRYLVPFMRQYIGKVDVERKEMELLAPELLT